MKTIQAALFVISLLLFSSSASAGECPIPGDYLPCDGTVSVTELMDYIDEWYMCSACVPDLFQAIQIYYEIPFCGDLSCNGDEDCSSCPGDCGSCVDPCAGITECADYTVDNCTTDPCNVSSTGCEWNGTDCVEKAVLPVFPQDYISYWKFDEEAGETTAHDSGHGGNDGTLGGDASFVEDADRGQVASFDGSGDIITLPASNVVYPNFGSINEISITAWFKTSASTFNNGQGRIITLHRQAGAATGVYLSMNNTGPMRGGLQGAGSVITTGTYNDDEWHFAALVCNGTHIVINIDSGSEVVSIAGTHGFGDFGSYRASIGAGNGYWYFNGLIDDVMIFNRSLTQTEIQQIMNMGIECSVNSDCNDNNDCTIDVCNSSDTSADSRGCIIENVEVGISCDDEFYCNSGDVCDGSGSCQAGAQIDCATHPDCTSDDISCTDEVCDELADNWSSVANNSKCTNPLFPICDAVLGCVECVSNGDCGACKVCNTSNRCEAITADNGNNCNNVCTKCEVGSCVTRDNEDNVECGVCKKCDGTNIDCQTVTADPGDAWNCFAPNECIFGTCCLDEDNNSICDGDVGDYYVSQNNPNCNDSGLGSSEIPFCSLTPAFQAATYGDTVLIRNGNYGYISNPISFPAYTGSMTEPLPADTEFITFKADTGHEPVFTGIRITSSSPIYTPYIFDGISIYSTGPGVVYQNMVGLRFKNCTMRGPYYPDLSNLFFAFDPWPTSNDLRIENCEISNYYGIFDNTYVRNLAIIGNDMYYIGDDFLLIGGLNVLIEGNHLHDQRKSGTPALSHPDAIPVGCGASNLVIRNNKIHGMQGAGIAFYGSKAGETTTNVLIENNLLYDIGNEEFTAYGPCVVGITVRHNIIIEHLGGYTQFNFENCDAYNNILLDDDIRSCGSYCDCSYNVRLLDYPNKDAALADLFVNAANGDYRLKEGAMAIDFGITQFGYPDTDIDGNPREDGMPDAGCYEYVG